MVPDTSGQHPLPRLPPAVSPLAPTKPAVPFSPTGGFGSVITALSSRSCPESRPGRERRSRWKPRAERSRRRHLVIDHVLRKDRGRCRSPPVRTPSSGAHNSLESLSTPCQWLGAQHLRRKPKLRCCLVPRTSLKHSQLAYRQAMPGTKRPRPLTVVVTVIWHDPAARVPGPGPPRRCNGARPGRPVRAHG
jgi:hypothetical protein